MSVYRGYERSAGQCPLWVKSGHLPTFARCPLYPRKRTWITTVMTSALCQKRTHALQQLIFRFRQNAFRRPDPSRNRPPVSSCLITTDRTRVIQQSRVNGEDEAASAKSRYTLRSVVLIGWVAVAQLQRLACRYTQRTALNGHVESRTDRPYGALYR